MFRKFHSTDSSFRLIPILARIVTVMAIVLPAIDLPSGVSPRTDQDQAPSNLITIIETNLDDYPDRKVPLYAMFEITFRINVDINPEDEHSINPYDFDEIKVEGCFTPPEDDSPAVELCQPGFFFQEYQKLLDQQGNPVSYEATGEPVWKVRFAPVTDAGDHIYQYYLKVQIQGGINDSTPPFTFEVGSSENKGFIRTQENQRYFRFDNGEPFIGVGLNVGWWEYDSQAISMYQGNLDDMQAFNVNLARIWMTNSVKEGPPDKGMLVANKIMSLQDRALGRQYNLLNAWYFDQIVEMAEDRNVYFILTLEDAHQFDSKVWKYGYNLYQEILNDGYDILDFDNVLARKYQQQVFRYVVARWGYSTSILSWEFWNEIDELINVLPDPQEKAEAWANMINWHTKMTEFLESIDIHEHLIDTSTGSFQLHRDLYMDTGIDFAQLHYYYVPEEDPSDPIGRDMAALTWYYAQQALNTYSNPPKPVIVGEFGLAGPRLEGEWSRSEDLDFDDAGVHLHNELWSSLMSGMATAGLHWHWHHLWRTDTAWWRHYAAIANFFEDIDTDGLRVLDPINEYYADKDSREDSSADFFSTTSNFRVMGLYNYEDEEDNAADEAAWIWVQNLDHIWWNYLRSWEQTCQSGSVAVTGQITVKNLRPNTYYRIEWWDPYVTEKEYQVVKSEIKKSIGRELVVPIVNLTTDVAIKIRPTSAAILVEKSIDRQGVNVGDSITVTTTITNKGMVPLTDIAIMDLFCPQDPIDLLDIGAKVDYYCVDKNIKMDTAYGSTVIANYSAPPFSGNVSDGAIAYLYVKDGTVGSEVLGSCTEEAFDVDLSTGEVGFNCGPAGHRYTIGFKSAKEITGRVSIVGGGNNLSGSNRVRLFDIKPGGKLTLDDIYLVSGAAHRCTPNESLNQGGGAIRNDGTLTLTNSLLYANSADFGGGIHNYANGQVSIDSGALMRNNARKDANPESGGDGGAIFNRGNLAIHQSTFSNNTADGGGALIVWNGGTADIIESQISNNTATNGGGIEVGVTEEDGSALYSTVAIHKSTINNNKAEQGGGVIVYFHGSVSLFNSTLSGNQADSPDSHGGGLLANNGEITLFDSTITSNKADDGGGIAIDSGVLQVRNSIIANNQNMQVPPEPAITDCSGDPALITSLGSNLIGISDGCKWVPAEGDQIGSVADPLDPLLQPLADNGGPTPTHALQPESPAIDAGNAEYCPDEDQRHADRSQGTTCDIGSFEMIQLEVNDIEVLEGNDGEQHVSISVGLYGPAVQDIQFDYSTEDGTASGSSDYLPDTGTLVIPEGSQRRDVDIRVIGDTLEEENEFFFFELTRVIHAIARDWRAQVTILDDDTAALQVNDVSASEPASGIAQMVFEVSLTVPSVQEIGVDYQTADGTAQSGLDYQPVSGRLIFLPGEATKSVLVNILADDLLEGDEYFILRLSNPANAEIADAEGQGTILDAEMLTVNLPLVIKD